jgi:hypothetical protein
MKVLVIALAFALTACSPPGPVTFSSPPKDAPVWNLNGSTVQGTNDLVQPPPERF